ncbi:hypothetical protein [Gramella sp. AN32]|uniref:Uncharacterized protein n=1 Tax=Christiangramia antarctica TaxID=2058158 RepID=A0ABW5X1H9_9FLAO|nr:hypothetical protein [Gramella sp. AN32]MCM4157948.1 hypothetical protein [Gramella sp. AN32]
MKVLKYIGVIFLTFISISCSKEENIDNELEGEWKVISFENYQDSTSITKTEDNTWPDFNNGDITISFIFSDNSKGNISGKNVTNTFYGDFTIDSKKNLSIDNTNWTEINEPEWGRLFHSIRLAEEYKIDSNKLTIYYNNEQNGIVLTKF